MSLLYFTEEHAIFRDAVRTFIKNEVIPNANEWEMNQQIPRSVWRRMGDLGFLGINYAESYGGMQADFFYSVIFLEEIAKSTLGGFAAAVSVSQFIACEYIDKVGNELQKQTYLKPAIQGSFIGALAITEPDTGSDVAAIKTNAKKEGSNFVINGSKTFITNGYYCDFVIVACQTEDGISLIIVDKNTPGFSSTKLKKMGWHCSDTGELHFDNVCVPQTNLLGEAGKGFYYIMESFALERIVASIMAVAGCEDALSASLKYMNERETFGKPIKKYQALRHQFVSMATEVEAGKALTYLACQLYNQKKYAVKEATMAKLLTTELGIKVANGCLQLFGGYGFMDEYVISRMYRDARAGTIVGGTSEIMKEILAKILIDDVKYKSIYQGEKQVSSTKNEEIKNIAILQNKTENIKMSKPETAREILFSLPERLKKDKAEGMESLFHFVLEGDNGGEFTVQLKDGDVKVEEGLQGDPACVVKSKASTYEDVELGRTNAQMAVMMGKIKISNLGEMMKFIGLFRRIAD